MSNDTSKMKKLLLFELLVVWFGKIWINTDVMWDEHFDIE